MIITSSHNPPEWNGMKVFRADGSLPLDEETDRFQDEANAMTVDDVITLDIDLALASGMVVERALTTSTWTRSRRSSTWPPRATRTCT